MSANLSTPLIRRARLRMFRLTLDEPARTRRDNPVAYADNRTSMDDAREALRAAVAEAEAAEAVVGQGVLFGGAA